MPRRQDNDDADAQPPHLYVVIPTLNEESSISRAIESALHNRARTPAFAGPRPHITVVDGGSSDRTRAVAARAGADAVLRATPPGRGAQLAAGWALVRGRAGPADVVLFLHADAVLPKSYDTSIAAALARHDRAWGAFATIDVTGGGASPSPPPLHPALAALIAACVRARTALLGLPYGDQAIFATAGALHAAGGVDAALPLMEDVDLVGRLSGVAGRPGIAAGAVAASPRRWVGGGFVATTVRNLAILARWKAGVPASLLAQEYYGRRGGGGRAGRRRRETSRLLW